MSTYDVTYDAELAGPHLHDVATGGVGDSVILLPKFCGIGGLLRALSSTGGFFNLFNLTVLMSSCIFLFLFSLCYTHEPTEQ